MSEEVVLEGFSQFEAERLVSRRVCAQCWSELKVIEYPGERTVQVICPACNESVEITGHISKNTPGIIMENARFACREVKFNLRDLFPTIRPKQTQEQIIHELGF